MEMLFSGEAEAIARRRMGEGERKETIKCNYTASSKNVIPAGTNTEIGGLHYFILQSHKDSFKAAASTTTAQFL
jgi:hypothetical protein